MNKEAPYRDQAERIRKKIDRSKSGSIGKEEELPPRSKLHAQKRSKNKWKLKHPVIRLLALFFILIPISIFSIYSYLNGFGGGKGGTAVESGGYERISVEKNKGTEITTEKPEEKSAPPDQQKEKGQGGGEATAPVHPSPLPENVVITGAESKDPPAPTPEPNEVEEKSKKEGEVVIHKVMPGENLFRISMKYYQTQEGIAIIKQANNIQGNEIHLGQNLNIPLDKKVSR